MKKIKPIFKQVKVEKLACSKCEDILQGNGSIVLPYYCRCGIWEYDEKEKGYILKQ